MWRILLLFCLVSNTSAERWTKIDSGLQTLVLTTFLVDYIQSKEIVKDGLESNPLTNLSPSLYFSSVAILHTGMMVVLPKTWRTIVQSVTIGIQLDVIHTNFTFGYRF